MNLDTYNKKNKKFFMPYHEHIVSGRSVFKEFKSEFPDELSNVFEKNEYLGIIKKLNYRMSESHNLVYLSIAKLLSSIATFSLFLLILWLIYSRLRGYTSVGQFMQRSLPVVGYLFLVSFVLALLSVIIFVVWKEVSLKVYIKKLNQIYNKKSITITCLGKGLKSKYPPQTIEIEYPSEYQTTSTLKYDEPQMILTTNENSPLLDK